MGWQKVRWYKIKYGCAIKKKFCNSQPEMRRVFLYNRETQISLVVYRVEGEREKMCFVWSQALSLLSAHELRVNLESSGLVNLISCQKSRDNESWLAFLAQLAVAQPH